MAHSYVNRWVAWEVRAKDASAFPPRSVFIVSCGRSLEGDSRWKSVFVYVPRRLSLGGQLRVHIHWTG